MKSRTVYTKDGLPATIIDDDAIVVITLRVMGSDVEGMKEEATKQFKCGHASWIMPSPFVTGLLMYFFGYDKPSDNGWSLMLLDHRKWTPEQAADFCKRYVQAFPKAGDKQDFFAA